MKRVFLLATLCLFAAAGCLHAKDKKEKPEPSIVMIWPNDASPTIKLTFGRFVQLAACNGQLSLESQVLMENASASAFHSRLSPYISLTKTKSASGTAI
jgi:hypothetical protein